jgi:hypothetical protein
MAHVGEKRNAFQLLVGKPEGKNHLKDLDVDGRIMLECVLKIRMGGHVLC